MIKILGGFIILTNHDSDQNDEAIQISKITAISKHRNGSTIRFSHSYDVYVMEKPIEILEVIENFYKNKIYKCANENGHFGR